jgi:hypothetical protein
MKKGCEEQGEGPGRRKAIGKTCADRKEKRKLGRKTKRFGRREGISNLSYKLNIFESIHFDLKIIFQLQC